MENFELRAKFLEVIDRTSFLNREFQIDYDQLGKDEFNSMDEIVSLEQSCVFPIFFYNEELWLCEDGVYIGFGEEEYTEIEKDLLEKEGFILDKDRFGNDCYFIKAMSVDEFLENTPDVCAKKLNKAFVQYLFVYNEVTTEEN